MAFIESSDAINYFNNTAVHPESSIYDQTFHFTEGYNQRLQRADMEHTQVGEGMEWPDVLAN